MINKALRQKTAAREVKACILKKLSLVGWYSPETGTQRGCEISGLESFPEVSSRKPQPTWWSIGSTPSWRKGCTTSPEFPSNPQYCWWHYEYMKSLHYTLITRDILASTTLTLKRNILEKASLIPGPSCLPEKDKHFYIQFLLGSDYAQSPEHRTLACKPDESQVHRHPWAPPPCHNIQHQPRKFSEARWRQLSNELAVPGTVNLPNSNYQMDIKKSEKLQRTVVKMINEQKALLI